MNLAVGRLALLLVGGLVCGAAVLTAGAASAEQQAIKGTVSGAMIQKVGFRAMIQKQAIMAIPCRLCSQHSGWNGEHKPARR